MNYLWDAVSPGGNSFDLLLFLAASAMKATLLLCFVALLCSVVRSLSATTRHLLWTLSLCAALLLPFLSFAEVWEVPVLPSQISSLSLSQSSELARATDDALQLPEEGTRQSHAVAPTETNESEQKISDFQTALSRVEKPLPGKSPSDAYIAPPQQVSATFLSKLVNWALAVWFAGALLLLFRLLVGFATTKWLTRGATRFKDARLTELFSSLLSELQVRGRVRLLRSERTLMPIVCGVFRPVVLLPAGADDWPEERRKIVLLHELTHVTRKDCLTQMLGQTACAFYWFNPFVWYAARRLRVEREQACDDYVLRIGTKPSDYAHHLLEIARYLQEHPVFQWSQTTTVAMARQSQLEGRLLAILSQEGKRRAMSQVTTAGIAALIFVLFSSLAIIRPTVSSALDTQASEIASGEETGAAPASLAGLFSTNASESKEGAIIQRAKPRESIETQAKDAGDENLTEKIVNGARVDRDGKPYLESDPGGNVEIKAAENMPPLPGNFPVPIMDIKPFVTVAPFIKAGYRQESKSEPRGKSGDFIDEMASVGYTNLSIDDLVRLKATGVTAEYVRSLRALGLGDLTMREVGSMSVNDVTPAFIESIRSAGYKDLTAKELLSFRIQGITPEFINRLRKAGYDNLSARQLTEFAIHAVTLEFINQMRAAGFSNLSPRELVTLRIHDITPEFIRAVRKRLGDLTLKQIITLKVEGLIEEPGDE
jgi:beta-lactamase regulating signal transducer with metallopeptidase domain